jgi:hypothetical protein
MHSITPKRLRWITCRLIDNPGAIHSSFLSFRHIWQHQILFGQDTTRCIGPSMATNKRRSVTSNKRITPHGASWLTSDTISCKHTTAVSPRGTKDQLTNCLQATTGSPGKDYELLRPSSPHYPPTMRSSLLSTSMITRTVYLRTAQSPQAFQSLRSQISLSPPHHFRRRNT